MVQLRPSESTGDDGNQAPFLLDCARTKHEYEQFANYSVQADISWGLHAECPVCGEAWQAKQRQWWSLIHLRVGTHVCFATARAPTMATLAPAPPGLRSLTNPDPCGIHPYLFAPVLERTAPRRRRGQNLCPPKPQESSKLQIRRGRKRASGAGAAVCEVQVAVRTSYRHREGRREKGIGKGTNVLPPGNYVCRGANVGWPGRRLGFANQPHIYDREASRSNGRAGSVESRNTVSGLWPGRSVVLHFRDSQRRLIHSSTRK